MVKTSFEQTSRMRLSPLVVLFLPVMMGNPVTPSDSPIGSDIRCRDSWVTSMPFDDFTVYSCSKCFVQVFWAKKNLIIMFPPQYPYLLIDTDDIQNNPENMTMLLPDPEAEPSKVCTHAQLTTGECQKWRACCLTAKKCCLETQQQISTDDNDTCPSTWDGIGCWEATPSGLNKHQPCPDHFVLDEVLWTYPNVYKMCNKDGTWAVNPNTSQEYSDYVSECFSHEANINVMRASLYIDFIGNAISIILLVIAIGIIIGFRNLRLELKQRTGLKIHFNLFVSVLCTSCFTVGFHSIYHDAFTSHDPLYHRNTVWCRALNIMTKYFKSSTYMCMFCEGLFLYRRISQVMKFGVTESLPKYIIISWGVPVVTIGVYVSVRLALDQNERCWIDDKGPSDLEYIFMIPNLCSLVCNFMFLLCIQYKLCTKMRTDTTNQRVQIFRHAIRATMSLTPIFGLQFLFLIYRPKNWPPYEIIVAIFESTLGALVAILYCFTTDEVKAELSSQMQSCKNRGRTSDLPRRSHCNGRRSVLPLKHRQGSSPNHRKRQNKLQTGLSMLKRKPNHDKKPKRGKRSGNVMERGVRLEVVHARRESCEARGTQRSCTDSASSSLNSQLKLDLKRNGYTTTQRSHSLYSESTDLNTSGVFSQTQPSPVIVHNADDGDISIHVPLMTGSASSNCVAISAHLDERPDMLSPIRELESHVSSETTS